MSLARLAPLGGHLDRVPREVADAARAVGDLVALGRSRAGDALLAVDDQLASVERRIMRLVEAEGSFGPQAEPLARPVDEKRRRLITTSRPFPARPQAKALAAGRYDYEELSAAHRRTLSARDALANVRLVLAELREEPANAPAQALDRLGG